MVRDERGFSLLENLIGVALVAFILAAYLTLLNTGFKTADLSDAKVTAQNLVRLAAHLTLLDPSRQRPRRLRRAATRHHPALRLRHDRGDHAVLRRRNLLLPRGDPAGQDHHLPRGKGVSQRRGPEDEQVSDA